MLSNRNREAVAGALLLLCAAGQERRQGKPGAAHLEQQARLMLGELIAEGQGITPEQAVAKADARLAEIAERAAATDRAIRERALGIGFVDHPAPVRRQLAAKPLELEPARFGRVDPLAAAGDMRPGYYLEAAAGGPLDAPRFIPAGSVEGFAERASVYGATTVSRERGQ